ncbi:MAG TPA: hypothetical protein VKX46_11345 [Ktedonobacteraceae bacterium]|nr:hypothetical protein [Ktedonobacteraceae bacterium]
MKKHLRLVSILIAVGGMGLLFLSGMLHQEVVTILGWVLIAAGLLGSFVSLAIDDAPSARRQEEQPPDSPDRGQLPPSWYSSGRR